MDNFEKMSKHQLDEILSGKTPEEIEKELDERGINIDGYGFTYPVRKDLRKKFPNSYFYCDYYDESICGVNLYTGSIIYELQHLGFLHTSHIEGHYGDLGDRLECGGIVANRMSKLTPEQLDGKIPPTVLVADRDLEDWDYLRGYLFGENIGGLLADGLI